MKHIFGISVFLVFLSLHLTEFAQSSQDQLRQIRSTKIEKVDGKEFYIHTVKRGQTLYMISKAYGVDINEVIKENPQVKEGIKADQTIRIPITKPAENPVVPVPSAEKKAIPAETKPTSTDSKKKEPKKDTVVTTKSATISKDTVPKKSIYKVALMLPLYLGEVGAINPEAQKANPDETIKSLQFVQFYEGIRLALDSLEKTGIKLKLFVYDVDKDTIKTRLILAKPELKSMNLIIGLLYHRNFQMVANFAEKNHILIINPVSERSELCSGNPVVFKIRPPKSSQNAQLAKYLEKSYPDAKILILRDNQFKDKEASEQLKKDCIQRKLNASGVDGLTATMNSLSKSKENIVVVFSGNTAYILELTRRLYELRNEYQLTLIGMPAWEKLEGLETEYLVGLHAHIMTQSFIDYQNPEVRKFTRRFQEVFKTDPDPLAFQGYDIAMFFLSSLWKFGNDFASQLSPVSKKYTQTTFEFNNSPGNGHENQHWEIVKYENYKLIRVN